jgi:translation initiation factor 1
MKPEKTYHSLEDLNQIGPQKTSESRIPPKPGSHDGKGKSVRITLDTRGRKGKSVTVVTGLQHNPATMEDIARILKQHCGAGGTVKEGTIEIQGDQRVRVTEKLKALNYVVQ